MHDVGQILTEFEESTEFDNETTESPEYAEQTGAPESPFNEEEEMELAVELLGIQNEEQLDEFLGKLFKKAVGAVKKFAKSPVGGSLFKILKGAAKTALPMLGTAAGAAFGGPLGAQVGGSLAGAAGKAFGLELEGLSPEDQEFEIARRYVRFAGSASQAAADAAATTPPAVAATRGAVAAARRHAPGLIRPYGARPGTWRQGAGCSCGTAPSGQWVRRGSNIILLNA
ncbi:MAG TPA: hypothetical protein VGK29_12510 [Paludibaculum sp.]|jgi:hypothetical protein